MDLAIETASLRKVYGSGKGEVVAVQSVDLAVERGEVFGFLGPNGAGKTTTLRMLSTLLPPTSGTAHVCGHDLLKDPGAVRRSIGYIGQRGGADEQVVGRSELILQGRIYGMSKAEASARAQELIAVVELEGFADRRVKSYSGGQRRRLDIALGLMHRPMLLFLDEPTTGLDPQSRSRIWDEIKRLQKDGMTIFVTTHYLDEADALCSRLAIIDHGQIVASGTPDALKKEVRGDVVTVGVAAAAQEEAAALLKDQPFVRDVLPEGGLLRLYVDRGETATPALLRLLDGRGIALETLSLSRPSLDDVFLTKTGRKLRETQREGGQ